VYYGQAADNRKKWPGDFFLEPIFRLLGPRFKDEFSVFFL
jgi:hypothetical protein